MNVDISIEDKDWASVPNLKKLARRAIGAALDDDNISLSLLFTSDSKILEINRQWLGKSVATNVLSFPVSAKTLVPAGELRPLGDIVLAFGVISREANAQKKPVAHHITHLIVHGTLHLLGYDHENDGDADVMETREIAILAGLGIENPYAS